MNRTGKHSAEGNVMSIEEQISQLIEKRKYETNKAQYKAKVKAVKP